MLSIHAQSSAVSQSVSHISFWFPSLSRHYYLDSFWPVALCGNHRFIFVLNIKRSKQGAADKACLSLRDSRDHSKHRKSDHWVQNKWSITRSKVSCPVQVQNYCWVFVWHHVRLKSAQEDSCVHLHSKFSQTPTLLSIFNLIVGKPLKRLRKWAGLHLILFNITEPQSTCILLLGNQRHL